MRVEAALLTEVNAPLVVTEVELEDPRPGEVLVRLEASGICHSDISFIEGKWPAPLPMILGHEGAGKIEAVGEGVDPDRVGESVVLTFVPGCGRCRHCLEGRVNLCEEAARCLDDGVLPDGTTRFAHQGRPAYVLGQVGSFATHAIATAQGAITVPDSLDPAHSCLLGCGVMTGVSAVTGIVQPRPGDSVAIFGCGGVGLSAIQGAALISLDPLIAVDPLPHKREMAIVLGATHAIDPFDGDPVEKIRSLTGGGVDYAFEALGKPRVAEQAVAAARTGGTTVLIGQPALGETAAIDVFEVTQFEHAVLGTHIGGATPVLEIPRLARLAASGRIDLDSLVTDRYPLSQVNEAIAKTISGDAGRVVLEL